LGWDRIEGWLLQITYGDINFVFLVWIECHVEELVP
jgi:hypothetical protein